MKKILIVIAVIIFVLYFLFPVFMGIYATFRFNEKVGNHPSGFKDIELLTSDKVKLKGWYKKPENGVAIIVVHGATSSRKHILKHINMLTENGYGVLAIDMRGHGESAGDGAVAYNWDGTKDIKAAVGYLLDQDEVKKIGALGLSLGGEVLLGSASANKEIKAIVTEGATERSTKDYIALKENKSLFRSYTTRLMYFTVGIISGKKEPVRIVDSIQEAKDTYFLFIAGGNKDKEVKYNTHFNSLVKENSKLLIIKNSNHTEGITKARKDYEKNIIEFYSKYL
jgi:esterase/lipase